MTERFTRIASNEIHYEVTLDDPDKISALKPVIAQAGFLPPETPTFEIRDARKDGERGMQVTNSARGAALARTLSSYPVALMRGHGEVVVGSSVRQAVVYAAYVDINARMQTQALLLSRDIVAIDLRLPDRVTVQLSEAAAALRAEALKEKKPAKKGGSA